MKGSAIRHTSRILFSVITAALFFVACENAAENVSQTGMGEYTSVDDLPKCEESNAGEWAVVKDEIEFRVCMDGEWKTMATGTSISEFSCKTEELEDKSGVKIICNGDSIGVVLNGKDGSDGKDGKKGATGDAGKNGNDGKDGIDCKLSERTDSTIIVVCGDSSITIDLRSGEAEPDSERIEMSLDSLVGVTQKGPFLKGSTVYLYELSDGRTLKQTNGNFTSNITSENGRYKFTARDLVSQYVMIVVDGYYRNEVTGGTSDAPIRLKALTDMRKRNSVNVNILTHLEFERVYHLVTREDSLTHTKKTVKHAKRQAQNEILSLFYIELPDTVDAEDMDVFGSSDFDAALLAISILLQAGRSESEMVALLTEISNELAESGKWEGNRAKTIKTEIADRALALDWEELRRNVEGWGLSDTIGNFEKFISSFIAQTYAIDPCGKENDGEERTVDNVLSVHHGKTYLCYNGTLIAKRAKNEYLNPDIEYGKMIDPRDRKMYSTVTIEHQTWMAENLNYADDVAYPILQRGGSLCLDGILENCEIYGRLYTYASAMDSAAVFSTDGIGCGMKASTCSVESNALVQGICPEGWRLPTKLELQHLRGSDDDLIDLIAKPYGEDEIGFSAIYFGSDYRVCFWVPGEYDWGSVVGYNIYGNGDCTYEYMSVRCVKD